MYPKPSPFETLASQAPQYEGSLQPAFTPEKPRKRPRMTPNNLTIYGTELTSRLFVGTAQYPSPAILAAAIKAAQTQIVTVSLRRESGAERAGEKFWSLVREL